MNSRINHYFNNDPINYKTSANRNTRINKLGRRIESERKRYQNFLNAMHEGAGYQNANRLATNYLRRNIFTKNFYDLNMKWYDDSALAKESQKLNNMKMEFNWSLPHS